MLKLLQTILFNSSNSIAMAGATVSNPGKLESIFSNLANLA